MKLNYYKWLYTIAIVFSMLSCKKETIATQDATDYPIQTLSDKSAVGFPETFETASKTGYAAGNISLPTGVWNLSDALIGTSSSDRKTGSRSIRIQNTGTVTTNFDLTGGIANISLKYAKYGSDASSSFELWISTNSGISWAKNGNTISVTSTTLSSTSFTLNSSFPVRLQLRKITGGKLNIDDLDVQLIPTGPARDDNMAMGNPSSATANIAAPENYLMIKSQYALSYNNTKGTANWVSWHLNRAWKGSAARCDCFTSDATLPSTFYKASSTSYTNSGFDRGHLCPSEDRDSTTAENASTFLMTNMMPQSPNLNRITWVALENYCRTLIDAGNELYIYSGGYGIGGTGSNGGTTNTIASGKITVPAYCWKVILVLPEGSNDATRVANSTRVIAVMMPNNQTVNSLSWGNYRVSVDYLENILGYDFFNVVPAAIQTVIESTTDNTTIN